MDDAAARKAIELTARFYADVADSFSQTRSSAWEGWRRVLNVAEAEAKATAGVVAAAEDKLATEAKATDGAVAAAEVGIMAGAVAATEAKATDGVKQLFDVLDIACGNMRFERFLAESGARVRSVCAVDNCLQLAELGLGRKAEGGSTKVILGEVASGQPGVSEACEEASFPFPVKFQQEDIFEGLGGYSGFNLVVCFGFMHHIPKSEQRLAHLRSLMQATCNGGIIAVSFWQLANSERLLGKARAATDRGAELFDISFDSENDYLLGWQDEQNAFRYCHNYTEGEIDGLVAALCHGGGVRQIDKFSSDGSSGDMNRYVILKVERR